MTALPSTGLHYGVPFDVYRAWPAVNISTLKPIRRTPLHCKYAAEHPVESDELNVGSALHVASFEPARYESEFYLGQVEYDGRTKVGKEIQAHELELAAGRKYIRRRKGDAVDCDSVKGMQESLWAYRPAKRILQMPGQCEVSAVWQDPDTGLSCKARFDKFIPTSSTFGHPLVIELKSTRDGSPYAFNRDIQKLGYAIQAAYYVWAVKVITGERPWHIFLGVENVAPYAAFWGQLDDPSLNAGHQIFRRCLELYAECLVRDEWPGYSEKLRELKLPDWAIRAETDDPLYDDTKSSTPNDS